MNKDMSALEKEIAFVESDVLAEEKENAISNYGFLKAEIAKQEKSLPYPSTKPYDTGIDYDDIADLQYQKGRNQPYWDKIAHLQKYSDKDRLYVGHIHMSNGCDYYITDSDLDPQALYGNSTLIYVDDIKYAKIIRGWRYPDENGSITFSRNITMFSKQVSDVDIVLDRSNSILSGISDAYLKKALIRNKNNGSIQSIIQTIQKKQDDIRSLPLNDSFIVQGCAGSGKTMVLLHRLRYLLYNKFIHSGNYLLLVPSFHFKHFVANIASEFRISNKLIMPFQKYYSYVLGKETAVSDSDDSELVFDKSYLARVYSKGFISECYREIFLLINEQTLSLIEYCDAQLTNMIQVEKQHIEDGIAQIHNDSLNSVLRTILPIKDYLSTGVSKYEDLSCLVDEINSIYAENKNLVEIAANPDYEIVISPDDPRVLSNKRLAQIKSEISLEEEAARNASIFTKIAHTNKLKKLNQKYNDEYLRVEKELIIEEQMQNAERAKNASLVFGVISLDEIGKMSEDITVTWKTSQEQLSVYEDRKNNIESFIQLKYKDIISTLNKLIEISTEIDEYSEPAITNLEVFPDFFLELLQSGKQLLDFFDGQSHKDGNNEVKKSLKLFNRISSSDLRSYINTLIFGECRRRIKEEFGISLCKKYKHYWYLSLYCHYLARGTISKPTEYLFIDETQDLSASEIELIYKINSAHSVQSSDKDRHPTINMFGDINQTVTDHGIKSWGEIYNTGLWQHGFSEKNYYTLDENFRNTNQIIDFCNRVLPYEMKKIGVDMEPVSEYSTLDDAMVSRRQSQSLVNNAIFIVKDEYARQDLQMLLSTINNVSFDSYEILTVIESKGLEFKEIFVIDRGMTDNERYIAFTRALVKLNVIKELPETTDHTQSLIVQGEEVVPEEIGASE